MKKNIAIKLPAQIPPGLVDAVACRFAKYTQADTIYHCSDFQEDGYYGVIGEAGYANYEYFIFVNGKLTTSDVGYGTDIAALRDVLNFIWPK